MSHGLNAISFPDRILQQSHPARTHKTTLITSMQKRQEDSGIQNLDKYLAESVCPKQYAISGRSIRKLSQQAHRNE